MSLPNAIEGTAYMPAFSPLPENLPTMYDLPSEDPQEPGLPDEFHHYQPQLLRETFRPPGYPQNQLFVGTDINLYYDPTHTRWYKRPDWFAVVGSPRSDQQSDLLLSYVVWQEKLVPYVVVELLSPGTEDEDLGRSLWDTAKPPTKWVVYEQLLKVPYYVVFSRYTLELKVIKRVGNTYRELQLSNKRLWFPEIRLGLGIWEGAFEGYTGKWLRWFDAEGHWLACPAEQLEAERVSLEQERARVEQERARAEQEKTRAEQEKARADKLLAQLQSLGVKPDTGED